VAFVVAEVFRRSCPYHIPPKEKGKKSPPSPLRRKRGGVVPRDFGGRALFQPK